MMESSKRLTSGERWRLKASRELLRGIYRDWPERSKVYLKEIEAGEAYFFWAPGKGAMEAWKRDMRLYKIAMWNIEEFGGGQV